MLLLAHRSRHFRFRFEGAQGRERVLLLISLLLLSALESSMLLMLLR